MKAPTEHLDYGIYIDRDKAFIIALNEFDRTQPALARIELNSEPEEEPSSFPTHEIQRAHLQRIKAFSKRVIDRLQNPHRVLLFGPSEAKYELHKELQTREPFSQVTKELIVSPQMNEALEAQTFTENYFLTRLPF